MKKILSFFKRKNIINIHIQSLGTFNIRSDKDLKETKQIVIDSLLKAVNDLKF